MCRCLHCDFCWCYKFHSLLGSVGKLSAETNFNFLAPLFNHISGISKNLADAWPAATRFLEVRRERALGTGLPKDIISFGKFTTKVFTRSVRVLYIVCSLTKVVLNSIKLLIDSLTVSPFFATKKNYEELDINNVCVLNIKTRFIFLDRQNHNIDGSIDTFV